MSQNTRYSNRHISGGFSGLPRLRNGGLLFEIAFLTVVLVFFAGIMQKWFFGVAAAPLGANWTEGTIETGGEAHIGNINVLVLGVDSVDGTHRADTIFVLGINPAKKRISMLSVPRDTRVLINGRARKINEILPRYGVEVLSTLIEDLLHIQISRYVEVSFQSFVNVIDILGGIEIEIEKAMNYDDNWGKVHIHFHAGKNHLDGRQALNYVRFRADAAADLGRIKRQQKFIKVLLEKVMTPGIVVKLPQIVSQVFKHIQTDFSLAEIIALIKAFEGMKVEFRNNSLPGEARYVDKISYFMPYQDEAAAIGSAQFSDLAAIELVASFSSNQPASATGAVTAGVASSVAVVGSETVATEPVTASISAEFQASAPASLSVTATATEKPDEN